MAATHEHDEIAGKTVRGSLYSGVAAGVTFGLAFLRTVLLARLLLPEHFGVMRFALFFLGISHSLHSFGLGTALIHSQDEREAVKRTYFSLQVGFNGVFTILLLSLAPLLQDLYPQVPQLGGVLTAIALISFISNFAFIQMTLLQKELAFFPLAVTEIASALAMTIVAPLSAWFGWGVWALVVEHGSQGFMRFLVTWGLFCRWRPRFGWDRQAAKLFWQFGKATWVGTNLAYFLDRFDDFWIGSTLGQLPLGYYTRAYEFACAPQRVFAFPLLDVFMPVFARLQQDRQRLSLAFFRCAYLLIRLVFFGAGLFAVIMPEFIHLVIGEKWLPMLLTFRLLLCFAVLDSFLMVVCDLLNAVGQPEALRNATVVQTIFFLPAVVAGAHLAGINGVALAADGMLLIGAWRLYRPLTKIIDVSLRHLFGWPVLAMIIAFGAGIFLETAMSASLWQLIFLKIGVFGVSFGTILLLTEWKEYVRHGKEIWHILKLKNQHYDF
ncbi:MAG: oligosaccharide flippase family protein [bacterium]|nr:oligosaccharide flippase family protein [bacterium]